MFNNKFSFTNKAMMLLTPTQRREFFHFIPLFILVMFLETLGLGLIVSILNILSQNNSDNNLLQYLEFLNIESFSTNEKFIIGVLILLFAYTIKTLLLTYVAFKDENFRTKIKISLSENLFKTYLKKPFEFHLKTNSAELTRNLNDINQFVVFVKYVLLFLVEIIVLTGVLILLLYYQPFGAIFSVLIIGTVGFIFHKKIQIKASVWGKDRQIHSGYRLKHIQQGFGAIKDIKILGREDTFIDQFSTHNKKSVLAEFKQSFVLELPRLWLEWLAVLGMVLLIFVMINQEKNLSSFVPTLGLFAAAAFRLLPSITRIMNSVQKIRFALPVINTLSEEFAFSNNSTSQQEPSSNNEIVIKDYIELNKINFSYPNSTKKILSNLNLKIQCGTSVGLIGASGIGKTTLINIILGLLKVSDGELLVDGKNIYKNIKSWQSQIGYVPQDIYLTDDTIRKNIAFGISEHEINNSQIINTIKGAQLNKFVNTLEKGVDTTVGECGERMSGGQRQRIGIARALYNNPKILVLDEATNSLDDKTEQAIIKEVNYLKGKKTIIMIAHRISTLSNCEKIYKMAEDGLEIVNPSN